MSASNCGIPFFAVRSIVHRNKNWKVTVQSHINLKLM